MLDIDLKGEYTFLMGNLFVYNMCMYKEVIWKNSANSASSSPIITGKSA